MFVLMIMIVIVMSLVGTKLKHSRSLSRTRLSPRTTLTLLSCLATSRLYHNSIVHAMAFTICLFSSKSKAQNRNKFHSKYVCFAGRKPRNERKSCLKIRLFGFPQRLIMGSTTMAARKVVSPSTLFIHLKFERALKLNSRSRSRSNSNRFSGLCHT